MLPGRAGDSALIDAVRAAPDDDEPRLVLADSLLERGDLHGELISVQCALARGGHSRARSIALRRREHELLAEHGAAWANVGDLSFEFRRGFVEAISVTPDRLLTDFVDLLLRAPFLHEVRLTGLRVDATSVEQIIDLPNIDGIDVAGGDELATRLAGQKRLGKLCTLRLRDVRLGALGALSRSTYADRLEHLLLLGNLSPQRWDDATRAELPGVTCGQRPRTLWLIDYGETRDIGYELDARLRQGLGARFFERVEDLRIGSAFRSFDGSRSLAFAGTGVLPRLKSLRCDTSFTDESLRLITESAELTSLEELHLGRERHVRQRFSLAPLCGETKLSRLRVLALGQHVVTADDAWRLLRSPLASQLEVLDLRSNIEIAPIAADLRAEWDGILLA